MAHNDVEVEVKMPVDEKTFLGVKNKLSKIAKFVRKIGQEDTYFTPIHRNFVEPKYPFEWLSIRKRGDKVIINYKHFHPENVEVTTHCDEFETEVNSNDKLEKIFSALNLTKLVTVKKEREVYVYKDEFEIALDDVKELGNFIEIEALKHDGSVEAVRKRLLEFAEELGIDTSKEDMCGYPCLLMKKKGLIK